MREILLLRPHARVVADVMDMLALLMHNDEFLRMMCDNSEKGNIKLDYSEGVAVYSKGKIFIIDISSQQTTVILFYRYMFDTVTV